MKQKIYILGLIITMMIFAGTFAKVNHFPGAQVLLVAGLGSLILIFIPAALINHYRYAGSGQNSLLYIVTGITCFVVFTGMLFKINHWPHAGLLLLIGLPFPYVVFLPVFLWVTSKNKNFNIYNLVFVLSLLAFNSVFSGLLSLGVSRERIEESYDIARTYNNLENKFEKMADSRPGNAVDNKIDATIKIAGEYKAIILGNEGVSCAQWAEGQANLIRSDAGAVAGSILLEQEGEPVGGRLEKALAGLLTEMSDAGGYDSFLKIAPEILGINYPPEKESGWSYFNFIDNFLPWSLIYLDAVITNLYFIRESVPSGK